MSERSVAQVVPEGDGLGEVLVEAQGPRRRSSDLGDLQGVGQADPVVIALGGYEHLCLVLQAAECQVAETYACTPRSRAIRLMRRLCHGSDTRNTVDRPFACMNSTAA